MNEGKVIQVAGPAVDVEFPAAALKATWSQWQGLPSHSDLQAYTRTGQADRDETIVNRGNVETASASSKKLSATYY